MFSIRSDRVDAVAQLVAQDVPGATRKEVLNVLTEDWGHGGQQVFLDVGELEELADRVAIRLTSRV